MTGIEDFPVKFPRLQQATRAALYLGRYQGNEHCRGLVRAAIAHIVIHIPRTPIKINELREWHQEAAGRPRRPS